MNFSSPSWVRENIPAILSLDQSVVTKNGSPGTEVWICLYSPDLEFLLECLKILLHVCCPEEFICFPHGIHSVSQRRIQWNKGTIAATESKECSYILAIRWNTPFLNPLHIIWNHLYSLRTTELLQYSCSQ